MDRNQFHAALRVLHSIDGDEFAAAMKGLEPGCTGTKSSAWQLFALEPAVYFIKCDDATCAALWAIIEKRAARRPA